MHCTDDSHGNDTLTDTISFIEQFSEKKLNFDFGMLIILYVDFYDVFMEILNRCVDTFSISIDLWG